MQNSPSAAPAHSYPDILSFYERLDQFDWFSCFSDSSDVYWRGERLFGEIEQIAIDNGPVFLWLKKSFSKHMASGESWNTPKFPKPPAPVEWTLSHYIELRVAYEHLQIERFARRAVGTDLIEQEAELLRAVFYLGAYSGGQKPPALIAGSVELSLAWSTGCTEVTEFSSQELERITIRQRAQAPR